MDIGKRFAGEGAECTCSTEKEHTELVLSVDESFSRDGHRRRTAPTSEQMRNRALAHTSLTNGHDTRRPTTI